MENNALPRHIAIIMDGNGRWAKQRGLPRKMGHAAGSETFRRIATYCKNLGVEYLTVYAFSTENWKRSQDEVQAIMALFEKYLHEAIDEMEQDHIRLKILGELGPISPKLRALIARTDEISTHYQGFQANICINYGGRDEIVRAARQCVADDAEISEEAISARLYAAAVDAPDPDLILRTGGYSRLSGYLPWQSIYSELYITPTLFPDLTREEFAWACRWFESIERTYGGNRAPAPAAAKTEEAAASGKE